jgi:CBS-domain-containing membrane protein
MRTRTDSPVQHVHRPRGETSRILACAPLDPEPVRAPSVADLIPVTQIMTREVICALPDLGGEAVAELMVKHHIGCIPIVNELGIPTGMLTKLDLLEHLLASVRDEPSPLAQSARDLMMPLALTLNDQATVAHAAAMMASEDIHHVPIVDRDGCMIGIVSTMDIARWLAANDGFMSATS